MVAPALETAASHGIIPGHPASKGLSQRLLSTLYTKELKDQSFYKGKILVMTSMSTGRVRNQMAF